MAWITPTGEVLNGWSGAGLAWDDDNGTNSSYDAARESWTPYLELTHIGIDCDKVQVWVSVEKDSMAEIEVDVYYSGAYHNIYKGVPTLGAFAEYTIGSTQLVTAMRIRCLNSRTTQSRLQYVHEADFNEAGGVTPGWNRLEYTEEPPTPNAFNQLSQEAGAGYKKLLYEGDKL